MKLLIYFLILANAVFLFWNWDVISGVASDRTDSQILVGETLVLKGDKQIPVPKTSQAQSPPSGNSVTGVISIVIGVLAQIGELFSDIFSDVPQELPAEEINLPPPVPKSTKCYELSGYATSATALNDLRILDTYGIKSKMLSKEPEEDTNRYRILVKVRASLDTAKKLSDLLSGSRIPNTIQEQTTLGSLLVTNFYASRKQAEQVNKKIRNLGFSSDIEASSKKTASKNTAGEKSYNLIIDQNEAVSWEKSRRDLIDLLNSKVKISELPRC